MTKRSRRLLALYILLAPSACAHEPGVRLSYNPTVDSVCSLFLGPDIQSSWREELEIVRPRLVEIWNERGTQLVAASEDVLGKPIDTDVRVQLTLCNTISRSRPLLVLNMRYALASFIDEPVSLGVKVGTLHHELLHRALAGMVPPDSALLASHADQHPRVRGHLHLLAVQKAAYLQLGLQEELEELVAVDRRLPTGFYATAWDIIDAEPDLYLKFVEELRSP